MIVQGSLNYVNGRRRVKTTAKRTKTPFVPLVTKYKKAASREECAPDPIHVPREKHDYRKEVSSKYTVAIAYNKGAYQVISPENIKDIGR